MRALVFDCFGVMRGAGSAGFFRDYPHALRDEYKRICRFGDVGDMERSQMIAAIAKLAGEPTEVINHKYHTDYHRPNTELITYIRDELYGKYKLAILSNVGKGWIDAYFDDDFLSLFDARLYSYEIGITKPDPRAYKKALEALGVEPSQALMIDDHDDNCRAAETVGMQSHHFVDTASLKQQLSGL